MTDLGADLLELARGAESEFVMCAPFAKSAVVEKVLSAVRSGALIVLYTRWRPDEIAAGVSDTEVLHVVEDRGGAVYLHDRLHAKFYRNQIDVLLGSANLTATALGWTHNWNLELLVRTERDTVAALEETLASESTRATAALAHEVEHLASMLPTLPLGDLSSEQHAEPRGWVWLPSLRMPSDLFTAYSEGSAKLTARSAAAAAQDLAVLDLPVGLNKTQFYLLVGHRLQQQPAIRQIDEFLSTPRRFGEIRDRITQVMGYDRGQAEDAWQTTMRWLLEYLPHRYNREVFRTSEVVSFVTSSDGPGSAT